MKKPTSPESLSLPLRVLRKVLPPKQRESIIGDLEEERLALETGAWWLWAQTLSIAPRYVGERLRQAVRRDISIRQDQEKGDGIMTRIFHDIHYSARTLRKSPLFTIVSILTLALAIGATTAIFSIVNALLIQPLPLPNADRLVAITGKTENGNDQYISYPDFEDIRRQAQLFEGFSAFVPQTVNLTGRSEPQRVRGGFVSDNFFRMIGIQPIAGRSFLPGKDDLESAERVCIVQYETWQNLFGSDPNFLGKSLVLNHESFTVIGILPEKFRFPFDEVEVWIPHHHWPHHRQAVQDGSIRSRLEGAVSPLAALKPGVTFEQGQSELRLMFEQLAKQHPEAGKRSAVLTTLREVVVGDVKQMVLVLFGAVLFVLLIACTNVANLLLSRAASRQHELATRVALGAGRRELVSQLFTETALLWFAGCAIGLLLGWWGLSALLAATPEDLPGGIVARMDPRVFGFAFCITAVTAVFFGLFPAIRFSTPNVFDAIKERSHSGSGSSGRSRLRGGLIIGQVSLTLILLVGSALMLRSFQRLTSVQVGFQPQNLLTMEYRLPRNKYPEASQQWLVHSQILEAIQKLPGVQRAALIGGLPFSGNGNTADFEILSRPRERAKLSARFNYCTPDYFRTMGIPVLKGRIFTEWDREGTPLVAVINQYMAEQHFSGQDPIGQSIRILEESQTATAEIIGVVGNTKHYGLDDSDMSYIYTSQSQGPGIFNTIVVRTAGEPLQMARSVTGAVWSVDPEQPVWKIRTQQSLIEKSVGLPKFLMQLMTTYAALALLLAAVGIYGVMSYSVTQRTHEIGVRVALGAQKGDVLKMILRYGLLLTGSGMVFGLIGSLVLGRTVQSLLFQTNPFDPPALAAVALLLSLIAMVASYLPARRATRVDPLVSLRYE